MTMRNTENTYDMTSRIDNNKMYIWRDRKMKILLFYQLVNLKSFGTSWNIQKDFHHYRILRLTIACDNLKAGSNEDGNWWELTGVGTVTQSWLGAALDAFQHNHIFEKWRHGQNTSSFIFQYQWSLERSLHSWLPTLINSHLRLSRRLNAIAVYITTYSY